MKYQHQILLFFGLILLISNLTIILTHKCSYGTENRVKTRNLVKLGSDLEDWQPIRIHLDFSLIDSNITNYSIKHVNFLRDKVLPKTLEVLQGLLKVRPLKKLKLTRNPCEKVKKIPDKYIKEGIDADLLIFIIMRNNSDSKDNSQVQASAMHCFQDDETLRPIAGYVRYRPIFGTENERDLDYMVWTSIHEITHILAFAEDLYDDWINPITFKQIGQNKILKKYVPNKGKTNITLISSPEVVKQAKLHYQCNDVKGIALENKGEGTAGSHWQKKVMNSDYMNGDIHGENLISPITIALFIDSGWYKADYEMANMFNWGKNQGCDFLFNDKKCVSTNSNGEVISQFKNSYCTNLDQPVCSNLHIFRGNCATKMWDKKLPDYQRYFKNPFKGGVSNLMEKCPIPIENTYGIPISGGSCRIGAPPKNSFEKVCPSCACFESSLKKTNSYSRFKERNSNESPFGRKKKAKNSNQKSSKSNFKAMCFDFSCNEGEIFVKINEKEYKCPDFTQVQVDGFSGTIKCPDSKVICNKKYFWKFGSLS